MWKSWAPGKAGRFSPYWDLWKADSNVQHSQKMRHFSERTKISWRPVQKSETELNKLGMIDYSSCKTWKCLSPKGRSFWCLCRNKTPIFSVRFSCLLIRETPTRNQTLKILEIQNRKCVLKGSFGSLEFRFGTSDNYFWTGRPWKNGWTVHFEPQLLYL